MYIRFEAPVPTESYNARFEVLTTMLVKIYFSFDVIATWMYRELYIKKTQHHLPEEMKLVKVIKCSCADICISLESGCNLRRLSPFLSSGSVKIRFYFVMMEQRWSLNIGHCLQIDVIVTPKDFIIPSIYAS